MLRRIYTLIRKDFFEFCYSKAWIIVLMMPLFIGFLYLVVYQQAETEKFTIAYTPNTDPALIETIKKSHLKLKLFSNQNLAKSALTQGKVKGIILKYAQSNQLSMLINKANSPEGVYIVNAINLALIKAHRNLEIPQFDLVYNNDSQLPVRWLSFPVWLLQIILTVCLLQAAAAIADEKEKQTLHSLLISPMKTMEYLLAKLTWYTIIGLGALFITITIIKAPINLWYVLLFGIAGSFTFGALSLLIGLIAPTALFARSIATVTYLIAALPLMVRDLSFAWKDSLYVFPSFLILKGFEKALLFNGEQPEITFWITLLLGQAVVFLFITRFYLQNKADF